MKKKKFVRLNKMKKDPKPVKKQKTDEIVDDVVEAEVIDDVPEDEPEPVDQKKKDVLCECGEPAQPGSQQCSKCAHRT